MRNMTFGETVWGKETATAVATMTVFVATMTATVAMTAATGATTSEVGGNMMMTATVTVAASEVIVLGTAIGAGLEANSGRLPPAGEGTQGRRSSGKRPRRCDSRRTTTSGG